MIHKILNTRDLIQDLNARFKLVFKHFHFKKYRLETGISKILLEGPPTAQICDKWSIIQP